MTPPAPDTPARNALISWLAAPVEPKRTQASLARSLGISSPAVLGWLRGNSRPGETLRQAIEALTGIPAADWELPEERTKREALVERLRAAKTDSEPDDSDPGESPKSEPKPSTPGKKAESAA